MNPEIRRLPLWRSCLDDMKLDGITYGQVFTAEFFETKLSVVRDTLDYGLSISFIRRELEKDGFYLSGRGQKGSQFVVLQPSSNSDVMASYSRAATDAITRGVILGTNTPLDSLSAEQRRRHESMLEKMAMKAALLHRSKQIFKAVQKSAPELISLPESSVG